tara:strand:- start:96 stop:2591 length:2496 start_codon:yes stop_codon:yes gene_type:complete
MTDEIRPLTAEEKQMLGLSPERVEGLALADGAERRSEIASMITRFTNALKDKARLIEREDERRAAFDKVPGKVKGARKYIKEQIKGKKAKKLQVAATSMEEVVKPFLRLNLYNQGARVTSVQLTSDKIKGRIDIRNPRKDVLNQINNVLGNEAAKLPENFRHNLELIQEALEDKLDVAEYKEFKINMNDFLGAVDVSKKSVRKRVYNYWAGIGKLYEQFEEDMSNFFIEVENIDFPEEIQNKFDKLYKQILDGRMNLEYIAKFPYITRPFESGYHRFFNIVVHKLAIDRMMDKDTSQIGYADDAGMEGDVNAQMLRYLESSLAEGSSTEGGAIDLDVSEWEDKLQQQTTWAEEYDQLNTEADPLLVYEYNRGEKLIAINSRMEGEIKGMLEDMIEYLDEGEGVSLETQVDIEEWLEQTVDTQILDEEEDFVLALPVSVLDNTQFAKMFGSKDKFPSVSEGDMIGSENVPAIKEFFNDLYDILSDEDFIAEVDARSSKGRGRGSRFDFYEGKGTTVGQISGGAVPLSLNQKGTMRGELQGFKQELQKMMDSAIQYYFDPIYSGMLPIEMPSFASGIGSKVLQTLSLDLGLDTVMSGAYDTLFAGSREEIDVGDMNKIADFLDSIFMPEVKIDVDLITDAEEFSDGLTNIFGNATEEKNDNYAAALLYHYMEETGDMKRANNKFAGKTIAERKEQFFKDFYSRKPFAVFALPHWLDMNQGILTKGSPAKKAAYNRLKAIFESAQVDLPVLLHKLLKAHDVIRNELGKKVIYGQIPMNEYGINKMITKMQVDDNIDLTSFEVEQIIKAVDSHENISREYGISSEQVYLIKASFR